MSEYHISVLLQEIVDGLQVQAGSKYIDATLGAGGHTKAILDKGGIVLGIDQDTDAIAYVQKTQRDQKTLHIIQGNFGHIDEIARKNGFEKVSGILFDLGVSSHQLDSANRGFSFLHQADLDMRMDTSLRVTAKDLISGMTQGELTALFSEYGEEPFAKKIASRVVESRKVKQIATTTELANLVASVYPRGNHKVHPATKVFQALRIAVNDELGQLKEALPKALDLLGRNGRIAIISFHSLEDRVVKQTFLDWEKKSLGKILTKKPIIPSEKEREENRKSRSSKLRIFEKR